MLFASVIGQAAGTQDEKGSSGLRGQRQHRDVSITVIVFLTVCSGSVRGTSHSAAAPAHFTLRTAEPCDSHHQQISTSHAHMRREFLCAARCVEEPYPLQEAWTSTVAGHVAATHVLSLWPLRPVSLSTWAGQPSA